MKKVYDVEAVKRAVPFEPISGHNPQLQQNMLDEVCYTFKTEDGKEPVISTFEFTVIEKGNPRRTGDHAGGYETSMMLHLAGDRVNMKANDGQEIPALAVSEAFPLSEATKEEGKIRFDLQIEGLVKLTREKLKKVLG